MASLLPLPIQTAYAELVERAHLDQLASEFDPTGRFHSKTIKGRDYWYFRTAATEGARRDRYVGPDTEQLRALIERQRLAKADRKQRRSLVAALIRSGLKGPDARTGRVLEAFAAAGVFRMRAVVVGTAAYQSFSGLLGARLANVNAMTDDLDTAQFASISIAIEDEIDAPSLLDVLKGVDPGFRALPEPFAPGRACRFALGAQFRVDILAPNRGPDDGGLIALPALKTDAQPLRFLDFLIFQEVQAVALHGIGVAINVPSPERYALHKLIVSRLRIATSEAQAKAAKDLRQAAELLDVLIEQRPYELKDLWQEIAGRGPKWGRLAGEGATLLEKISAKVSTKLRDLLGDYSAGLATSRPRAASPTNHG